jgi:hypothetical protein
VQYIATTIVGINSGSSGDGGKATSAKVNTPYGVFVDKFNLMYIADAGNFRIRRVNLTSNIISLFAGSSQGSNLGGSLTTTQFDTPRSITKDTAGNLFVVDSANDEIRKITTNNIISSYISSSNNNYLINCIIGYFINSI